MLVMMKYRFSGGAAGRQAYERFAKVTPSEGFEIKDGWTSANNDGGFLLLDVVDVATLLESRRSSRTSMTRWKLPQL